MKTMVPSRRSLGQAPERPQLTSLVDMMVILVVFLLHSFSVEGQLVEPAGGVDLPVSAIQAPVPAGLQISVGPENIHVAGRLVAATGTEQAAALVAAALPFGGSQTLLIQADRRVAYRDLGAVLAACTEAGWHDVSLIVLGGES